MAQQLNIEPATYSKIETSRTRLAVDMLEKIATILEVSPLVLMNKDNKVNSSENASNDGKMIHLSNAETPHNYRKVLIDIMDAVKDVEIASLKNTVQIQQKLLQQQSIVIEKLGGIN